MKRCTMLSNSRRRMKFFMVAGFGSLVLAAVAPSYSVNGQPAPADEIKHRVMEAYPEPLLASIEQVNRARSAGIEAQPGSPGVESVIRTALRWPQRRTVTVAFLDGNK